MEHKNSQDARDEFVKAAVWHGSLDRAEKLLEACPDVAGSDIGVAAILGDVASVRQFLARDASQATTPIGTLGWDALTHLCFSKYLRLSPERSAGFIEAAQALLEAGASANTGFWEESHSPRPVRESVLYGAAGVAHHAGLTKLLLDYGADPNDEEVPYHAPETYDLGALTVLLESRRLTADSLATMLLRKADWHDLAGMRLLCDHGADPNRLTQWGYTALHQSVRRDNLLELVDLLLDRGADAFLPNAHDRRTAASLAAWRGRGDILASLVRRQGPVEFAGVETLIAACASADVEQVRWLVAAEPGLVAEVVSLGGTLLSQFAGNGNALGVRILLDLGVPVDARFADGDGYYDIAPQSTALHVAAWRARHETVAALLDRGATVNVRDGRGRTPLMLAVRACVDSYWSYRRKPDSIAALLAAGASKDGVVLPCGYPEADALLT